VEGVKWTIIVDATKMAVKAIRERKIRSTLTIIGIIIGPMIMIMMGSVVKGYSDYIVNQISSMGQNTIIIYPESGYKLTQEDLNQIRGMEGVAEAEPFYTMQGTMKIGGSETRIYVYATKIDLILRAIGSLEIMSGETPNPTSTIEALVGYRIAYTENGEKQYDIGDTLTITVSEIQGGRITQTRRINVKITGILKEYGGALLFSPDQAIFLNTEAGRKLLNQNEWSGIIVLMKDSKSVAPFTIKMRETYQGKISVISFAAIANIATSITEAINLINYTTSTASLAVAVMGIAATMITSVMERTREIGVMKAVGFTNTQIITLILMEALTMSIIGGIIGETLGVIGAHLFAGQGLKITSGTTTITIQAKPAITPQLITTTTILTLATGIIGGALPAYMAAKIPPATALRYE
jgi:putative ABC transport system permease protein